MVQIRIIYANMGKFRIKLNKLLYKLTVGISLPQSAAETPVSILNGVCKQETTIRQYGKIGHKIININLPVITAVNSVNKYLVVVAVQDEHLVPVRKQVKPLNNAVIAKTVTLTEEPSYKTTLSVKKEQGIGRTHNDCVTQQFYLID